MRVVHSKQQVKAAVAAARRDGRRIALVPTMGYLHEGHLSLIDRARELADWVAVSSFVNPLQFGPGEDLDRYPRDPGRDALLAQTRRADLMFLPSAAEIYPWGEPWISVVPEQAADRLCGLARPGHFRGVLTMVAKLFGIFAPDVSVFGQKDLQQVTLVRRMVTDLDMDVRIEVAPIVRDADGLAMSSRNVYLSPEERERALVLPRALELCREHFAAGERRGDTIRAAMRNAMSIDGVQVEYADVVDPETLDSLSCAAAGSVCAVAARVGRTRLIDNSVLGT
jgi:pantoate--beta-alanine ligase